MVYKECFIFCYHSKYYNIPIYVWKLDFLRPSDFIIKARSTVVVVFFVKLNMYVLPTIGYRVNRASLRIYNIMDPKSLVCYWNDNKDCFYNVDTNSYESTGTK